MNLHDRDTFNGAINLILRGLGDELGSKIRRGLDYFRSVEAENEKLRVENDLLKSEITRLEGQVQYLKTANRSTEQLAIPKVTEDVEPTSNIALGNRGVIRPNEDDIETDRMDTVQKKSFLSRLFRK